MDLRRLVLGDWHPLIRDGIDVLRLALPVGAVVGAVTRSAAVAAVLVSFTVIALLARMVNLPRLLDLALVLALVLQGWAEVLGAYDALPWFDRLVHVTLPLLTSPVLYVALARLDVLPDPQQETHVRHYVGIGIVTVSLGLAVGAVWEIAEWASDAMLGSDLSEDNSDTVGDLLADTVGSVAGAALLLLWTRFSWGSVRRVPGDNRREEVRA